MKFKSKTDIKFKNETERFFHDLSFLCYLSGYPKLWIKDLPITKTFDKYYSIFSKILDVLLPMVILMEFGALYTQPDFTEKQRYDIYSRCLIHPLLWGYRYNVIFKRTEIIDIYSDILNMKDVYNNVDFEKKMVKRAYTLSCMLKSLYVTTILQLISSATWSIKSGEPFMGLCTAWPLIEDRSAMAYFARGVFIILWFLMTNRMLVTHFILISLNTALRYQFQNLYSYFLSLDSCFHTKTDQTEMERKYIEGLVTGIKLHDVTLSCTQRFYDMFKWILISFNIIPITLQVSMIMSLAKSERTPANLVAAMFTAGVSYIFTGVLVCSTGDIAIEASKLDEAIFGSGWHNCRKEALKRAKGLVIITMCRAQESLVFTALGFVEISYDSFIKMVKLSYSAFSFVYTMDQI